MLKFPIKQINLPASDIKNSFKQQSKNFIKCKKLLYNLKYVYIKYKKYEIRLVIYKILL